MTLTLVIVAIANALVGACIGLTGIAGFLLPMFYAGFLGLSPVEGLALSFAAFLVSGILGCPAYRRTGDLPIRPCGALALGSFLGALAGTRVGLLLPPQVLTVILYLVVLGSGTSVLVRMRTDARHDGAPSTEEMPAAGKLFAIGLVTAVVCAASGAGGPVLVVPILMLLGISPRRAVGMALLDSVAIAIPATIGYFVGGSVGAVVWGLLPVALVAHGVGVVVGSMNAHRINANLLKAIVAIGSVAVAVMKLVMLFA